MKHLEEHISESVARKTFGKYAKTCEVDPNSLRKGMKLKIKEDLSEWNEGTGSNQKIVVRGFTVYSDMKKYIGKTVTVVSFELLGDSAIVDVEENVYSWPLEIFEYA